MRGALLAIVIFIAGLCLPCLGQKVQYNVTAKDEVLQRMAGAPATNQDRAKRMMELFRDAGCYGAFLKKQEVAAEEAPNIICRLPGSGDETIVVGAHYELPSSAQRPIDNWSAASLLPSLYESLRQRRRRHSFIFVAFADRGNEVSGADFFVSQMTPSETQHIPAMVNLDPLGLSPTKVWVQHSDKELVHNLVEAMYFLKLPGSQIDIETAGNTDSQPFSARKIPQITIHSLTQENLTTGAATQFRPNNYFDTYRLLGGYLAFLDTALKPRPNPK